MAKKKGRLKLRFLILVLTVLLPTSVLTLSIISDPRIASKVEFTTGESSYVAVPGYTPSITVTVRRHLQLKFYLFLKVISSYYY